MTLIPFSSLPISFLPFSPLLFSCLPFSSHALGEEVVEVVIELDLENPMIDMADWMLSSLSYNTMRKRGIEER